MPWRGCGGAGRALGSAVPSQRLQCGSFYDSIPQGPISLQNRTKAHGPITRCCSPRQPNVSACRRGATSPCQQIPNDSPRQAVRNAHPKGQYRRDPVGETFGCAVSGVSCKPQRIKPRQAVPTPKAPRCHPNADSCQKADEQRPIFVDPENRSPGQEVAGRPPASQPKSARFASPPSDVLLER